MLVNLYHAISLPVKGRGGTAPAARHSLSIEARPIEARLVNDGVEQRLPEDVVTLSDAAKQYQKDKEALDSALGKLLNGKNANITQQTLRNEDEGLSVIEKQIERIKEELERLKQELRAISGDNSESAKLERKIIQEQMMLLTVEMMSLLERKMSQAKA
ncbi:hypothetical protein [Shewanella sp. UCD-KL12]|uniref:hypothetical protein n=1 Tax=Shewanella sp. UCD-KL12 TaxID=1917163 RepID=UPI0011810827|nr:hypothetical protein [Shewanella sp. UCD-KL12]